MASAEKEAASRLESAHRLRPDPAWGTRARLPRIRRIAAKPSLCYILSYAQMDARKNETTP